MQRKLILIAYILICADCFAQQYPFVYYTPKDGLVNSRVRDIWQDRKGRMYFITHGGLSIYDGKRFINYDSRNGLANNLVNDIAEAAPDSLLVATNAPILNTLVHGRVGVFKTSDDFCPTINRFFKCSDGSLYVAADEGLFRFDKDHFTKLRMTDTQGTEIGCCLDRILEWKNYLLLMPWDNNLKEKMILYDRATGKVSDIELKIQGVTAIEDQEGQIWSTTNEGLRLLDTAALNRGEIIFQPIPSRYRDINGTKGILVFFDSNHQKWFYSNQKVSIFSASQRKDINTEQSLGPFFLTDLFIDREGSLWLGTDGNGIAKLSNKNVELLSRVGRDAISCQGIALQNDTTWFLNAANNSVYRFAENTYTQFRLRSDLKNLANLYLDHEHLWLGNHETLLRIDNKNNAADYLHPHTSLPTRDEVRLGNGMMSKDGVIIQYAVEDGIRCYLYVLQNDRLIMKQPVTNAIDQMNFDKKGRFWFTTRDNRLFCFTLHPDQPSKYLQLENSFPKDLGGINPRSITIDQPGNIWIGTRYNGIYKFQCNGDKLEQLAQYTIKDGLTDNFVSFLACDNNNTIWAGTQTGLDKIYHKNDQLIIGNISKSNSFFQSVSRIITTSDNTVWGITNEAILKIAEPDNGPLSAEAPPLILTSLEVNNSPWHDSSNNFSHRHNNFSFEVASPSFIDERSIQYSYLLEGGGHASWSAPSNNATFNFINLAPGHYTLKVRAEFPERIYPAQMMSYSFSITPPWWQTWWARLGIAAAVLTLLILITRFYYAGKLEKQKHFLERKQAIEKERTRIATDMHDDLGAGLSRIKFLSETIGIKKQRQQPVEEDIDKIRMYSHEMIDKMGEIVWALNEKNDSLIDLLAYTRVYAVQYLSENGIDCAVNIPAQIPSLTINGEFRRNIYLTVKEALHNIVKHAQARKVKIDIETGFSLCVRIIDDGLGFDAANIRPWCNGLNNMKKRIESIQGKLQISNTVGTTISFTVPLN